MKISTGLRKMMMIGLALILFNEMSCVIYASMLDAND
jgi:hypothetical protein